MKTENISLTNSEKIAFIISLSTMIASGITIIESIDSMLEDAKGNQKKMLQVLKDDVFQGKRLYSSLAKFPRVFNKVNVNIIKASEEAGTLDTTLKQIKDNMQKESEFNGKVKSAFTYPLFISVVFIGVLLMILVVVVPKIGTVFLQLKVPLPLPTRILIFLSDLIIKHTIPLVAALAAIMGILVYLFTSHRKLMTQVLFSVPGISGLIIRIDLVRFTRSMGMMYGAGLNIINAIELCEDVVINKKIKQMIVYTKETIYSGKHLSEGLKSYKEILPSIMIKIIEAGERSGKLNQSLVEVADYLDQEVSNTLKVLTTLLEPIILVLVGIMVGGMMLSIIAPIYGLIGQVGAY